MTCDVTPFATGSILSVTMKDPHANGKANHFVGICTQRSGTGLGATFILRNIIDGQGTPMLFSFPIIVQAFLFRISEHFRCELRLCRHSGIFVIVLMYFDDLLLSACVLNCWIFNVVCLRSRQV